jgi:EAL domain-containing protein (putative c-di-GMP-specific phosphodiesterase class I)
LSGASLNDERFTETMMELARQHPHIVRKLCFEITEDVALKDFESTRRFISRVKAIGARISLDDFGAGYSSFAYLTQLQIDSVKIDGSLIRGLHLNGSKQAIVRAIVDLCRALNNKVVSEWVETPEELITLRNLGVDAVQGYLVGRPTDSAHAKNWKSGDALVADPVVKQIIVNTKSASAVNVS